MSFVHLHVHTEYSLLDYLQTYHGKNIKEIQVITSAGANESAAMGGTAGAVIGCGLGSLALVSRALWGVLAVGGFGVLLAGLAIGYRFTVCPHCGAPLYDFPRMPSEIPAYCPSCGKKIDPPADH